MIKSGDYVIVTEHNYDKLKRCARTRTYPDNLQYGSIYHIVNYPLYPLDNDFTYLISFVCESLEDFINNSPNIDADLIKIGFSRFDFKARKLERELKQRILDYQKQIKQKKVESTTDYKLNSLVTDFSEPLFAKLATEAKAIESVTSQITTIKENCPWYSQKYTVAFEVIDNYNKRKQELTELLEIFNAKRNDYELELLNNKADQALEQI